jgi:site-specific recombinase XerD
MSSFAHGRWSRIARLFLRTRKDPKGRAIVRQLYRWMAAQQLSHAELQAAHLDRLLESPFGQPLARRTRYDYRGELLAYLEWLYAKGELSFDPSELRRGRRQCRPLPELAEQYVASLAVTLRPSTCDNYRTHLRRFCGWLDEYGVAVSQLEREQVTCWLAHLHERGLNPATRFQTILQVRALLRWLYERGLLVRPAEQLIRSTDLPKLPRYLPRPLSPTADRQLRARLSASSCRYQQGLLLMRHTGLRIGELCALEYDCVRSDPRGNRFLKVPLGKLAVHRGAKVYATDGHIGVLEEFVVEPESSHITHIVLSKGHLWGKRDVVIPVSVVDHGEYDNLYLNIEKKTVKDLPGVSIQRHYGGQE